MRGRETKIFKRGSRGGCLKKGGWNPLMNYEDPMTNLASIYYML